MCVCLCVCGGAVRTRMAGGRHKQMVVWKHAHPPFIHPPHRPSLLIYLPRYLPYLHTYIPWWPGRGGRGSSIHLPIHLPTHPPTHLPYLPTLPTMVARKSKERFATPATELKRCSRWMKPPTRKQEPVNVDLLEKGKRRLVCDAFSFYTLPPTLLHTPHHRHSVPLSIDTHIP